MNKKALQKIVIKALEDLKAVDIIVKDVVDMTDMTDIMIFASGTSSRHVKSLASNIVEQVKKQGVQPIGVEGEDTGDWILVDLASVLVHIMLPEVRNLYDLEKLWSGEIRPAE
jgi:ribosome-associated protein